jgi:hypothetical protein
MRRFALPAAAGLCLAALAGFGPARADEGCSGHGTSVAFYDTPSQAAARAKKEQKLVFVLHVSGNFEDPRFT